MTAQSENKQLQPSASSTAPHTSGILQRRCACGNHTHSHACEHCGSRQANPLQRAAAGPGRDTAVPPIVHEVLRSPGQPLDTTTRTDFEARFGHDFSRVRLSARHLGSRVPLAIGAADSPHERAADRAAARALYHPSRTGLPSRPPLFGHVRVHTGARATESARAIHAAAYTAGPHIVFGSASYAPRSADGRALLAHELAHVQQQGSDRALSGVIQRRGPSIGGFFRNLGRAIADVFGDEPGYERETLLRYLRTIDEAGDIEKDYDSDNKARAIVNIWASGDPSFVLTPRRKALLIRELQSGFTGDDDELAILEVLERSENYELRSIFGAGGVASAELNSDFHFAEWARLQDFYARRFRGGMQAVLAGQIDPIGRAVPLGRTLSAGPGPDEHPGDAIQETTCSVRSPENCHIYEGWISQFTTLPTFQARSGHQVIGPAAAPRATATDPAAPAGQRRPEVLHARTPYLETDRFIDGPTDEWVRANLPPNLVETAYQLPADCADMAVILRHVWLVAHNRTELYQGWVCGIGARRGDPRSDEIRDLIRNQIYTGNVERIVRPYTDANGAPLLNVITLGPLLRPGDVLVWEHQDNRGQRTGGHTQTIMHIQRNGSGAIQWIDLLQGNQPISEAQAGAFRRGEQAAGRSAPSVSALREAPGRRIEVSRLEGDELVNNSSGVWAWPDGTVLVAAGPPTTGHQPAARRGGRAAPRLADWAVDLRTAADLAGLQSLFEAALLEARTSLLSGQAVAQADGRGIGAAAGARLWELATQAARGAQGPLDAADLGEESHYRPLQHMLGMARELRRGASTADGRALFAAIEEAFEPAARGISTVAFQRQSIPSGFQPMHVLLTGFDPFHFAGGRQVAPLPGHFNPSGAAVLQLDGQRIDDSQSRVSAAVEGAVLPVSFARFRAGMVESLLGAHAAQINAVITVSLDPGIAPTEDVELEQFAVGVHELNNDVLEPVPALSQGEDPGPALLEAQGNLQEIARSAGVAPDRIDTEVQLDFIEAAEADRALRALGLATQGQQVVTISDMPALRQIAQTMERSAQGGGVTFRSSNGQAFQAIILRGPGGSFLSNEVSYRVLRLLGQQPGGSAATSFHVHTPRGTTAVGAAIPQGQRTASERGGRQQAIAIGRGVVQRLVSRLETLIRAIARRFGQRTPGSRP